MTTKLLAGWKPSRCGTTASTSDGELTRTRGLAFSGLGPDSGSPQAGGGLRSSRTGAGAGDPGRGGRACAGGREPGSPRVRGTEVRGTEVRATGARGTGLPDGCAVSMTSGWFAATAETRGTSHSVDNPSPCARPSTAG